MAHKQLLLQAWGWEERDRTKSRHLAMGSPNSFLPIPIQTRRRVQAFPPQRLGIQKGRSQASSQKPQPLIPNPIATHLGLYRKARHRRVKQNELPASLIACKRKMKNLLLPSSFLPQKKKASQYIFAECLLCSFGSR